MEGANMKSFVAYYRVSTRAQERSGLGLVAQRKAVVDYVSSQQGLIKAEFSEVESGSNSDRPLLDEALKRCRREKSVLVIAKLDRLARNVSFIAQLMNSGVEFVAADMPSANKLTVHIFAAMAEYERDAISARTSVALQAAKDRGVTLGNPRLSAVASLGVKKNQRLADDFARRLMPLVNALRAQGVDTYSSLAEALNRSGARTRRGCAWTSTAVRNLSLRKV
jgi:DNA invertase Pin-like site-specific DNA recombinase